MAESKKPAAKAKAIADVVQPGKTPPSENSRSIITHRTLMQDPMVVSDTATDTEKATAPAAPKPAKVGGEMKLQPLDEAKSEDQPKAEVKSKPDEAATAPAETETEPKPTPTIDPKHEEESEDDKPSEKSSDKPSFEAEAAAAEAKKAEHDATIQKLIESKQYFLPVNAVERRRSKRFVALGILLSLLLAAAWLNIALDAGLVEIPGLKPLTHFFST